MKNFEIEALGLVELNIAEMQATNGGFIPRPNDFLKLKGKAKSKKKPIIKK